MTIVTQDPFFVFPVCPSVRAIRRENQWENHSQPQPPPAFATENPVPFVFPQTHIPWPRSGHPVADTASPAQQVRDLPDAADHLDTAGHQQSRAPQLAFKHP